MNFTPELFLAFGTGVVVTLTVSMVRHQIRERREERERLAALKEKMRDEAEDRLRDKYYSLDDRLAALERSLNEKQP